MECVVEQAALRIFAALEHDRAGAVAEEDAGVAVLVVDDAAEGLGADHQDVFVLPSANEVRAGDQRVNKPAARGHHVKRWRAGDAQLGADETGGRGEDHFRCDGGDDDQLDIFGLQPGRLDGAAGGGGSQRRGGFARAGDATLTDPGPLNDPFVVGFDHLRQVVVGQPAIGKTASRAGEDGAEVGHAERWQI